MRRSPTRLVIALSIAAALAVFIVYTSIAGAGTPQVQPSDLPHQQGNVLLVGRVVGAPTGNAHGEGLRFTLRNVRGNTAATVPVTYTGSVPDLFRPGRDVVVEGAMRGSIFVGKRDSLSTKCPSKYQPAKTKT